MVTRTTTTRIIPGECALAANACDPGPVALPTFEEVVQAYYDCRKNKRNSNGNLDFEANVSENLLSLYYDLTTGNYEIGPSICFIVTYPKPREVWAASFRDRVVHHLVYNRLKGRYHASFSPASCACIPSRGTLYGVRRLERIVRRESQNWKVRAYYLKMDVSNFFTSIDKRILFDMLDGKHDAWLSWVLRKIIFHDPTTNYVYQGRRSLQELVPKHKSLFHSGQNKGLAIGNLSSQFFANVYMDAVDKMIDHKIRPGGYVRYVDDMILVDTDKDRLIRARDTVSSFLCDKLGLELNPRKTILQPVSRGVDFVGHVILPWRTIPRRAIVHKARRATRAEANSDRRVQVANSYLGLMGQSNGRYARASLCKLMMKMGHPASFDFSKILPA